MIFKNQNLNCFMLFNGKSELSIKVIKNVEISSRFSKIIIKLFGFLDINQKQNNKKIFK